MVGGRGVRMAPQSAVTEAELFVCVDVDAGQSEAIVRQASAIEREWLPERRLRTVDEAFFHPTQKSVVGRRRTYWDDLALDEVSIPAPAGEETARILAEAACARLGPRLPGGRSGRELFSGTSAVFGGLDARSETPQFR